VTPRIESQTQFDPFTPNASRAASAQYGGPRSLNPAPVAAPDSQGNMPPGAQQQPSGFVPPPGGAPTDPFKNPPRPKSDASGTSPVRTAASEAILSDDAALRLSPRISPQPTTLTMKQGEQKLWTVVGMDLDGLTTDGISFRYDPHTIDIEEVMFGPALSVDPKTPPVVTIDRNSGLVKISSSNGKPLAFQSGGELLMFRLQGMMAGDAALVLDVPELKNSSGQLVLGAISGGRARIE
jgi:hypothetical protein